MAQEVKIDLNARDYYKNTGFIYACYYKHSEVINHIMAKAESLQIDLHCKDNDGKSGFEFLSISKMDRFKYAIKDNDTDKALELKQEFDLDLKRALFDAIKEDEEAAIAIIENCQRLNLSLD